MDEQPPSSARQRQGRARTFEELVAFAEGEGYANPAGYARRVLLAREGRKRKPLLRTRAGNGLPQWGNPGYGKAKDA